MQEPQDTHINNIHKTSGTETHKNTHMPEFRPKNEVESQKSAMHETSPQVSGPSTEPLPGKQTVSTPVRSLNYSKKRQYEIQRRGMKITANDNGDGKTCPPKVTNSQIEEKLVGDDITNDLHMPLSSLIDLKRKKEMVYVPLDYQNGLTIDALVHSGAYVTAIAQTELDRIKQKNPTNIFKIIDTPNFQIQVAIGQLQKPIQGTL